MDPLGSIQKLAERARLDEAPTMDVSAAVLARIAPRRVPRVLPLSLFAAASAAAAMIVMAIGLYYWLGEPDPMTEYLAPLQMVSLW